MADPNSDTDPQDTAEAFDEDNLDDTETYKFRTFEENPDLLDLTRADGDADEDEDDDTEFLALEDEDREEEIERVRTDGYDESDVDDVTDRDARDGVDDEAAYLGRECVVKLVNGPTLLKRVMRGSERGTFLLLSYNASPLDNARLEWASPVRWVRRR